MVDAQKYLDRNYPTETRKNLKILDIRGLELEKGLKLEGFINLEKLNCSNNKISELSISNCSNLKEINCSLNELTKLKIDNCDSLTRLACSCNELDSISFLTDLSKITKEKLTHLDVSDNNISKYDKKVLNTKLNKRPQDLDFLAEFINLEYLYLENEPLIKLNKLKNLDVSNNFGIYGSLEYLKEANDLKQLNIKGTDLEQEALSKDLKLIEVRDGSYETQIQKNDIKNILLIGRTSSGSSTLVNVISGTDKFKEGHSAISETRDIQTEEFEYEGIKYRIIDTPGFDHTLLPIEEILNKIIEAVYSIKDGISQILFVFGGKITEKEVTIFHSLKEVFGEGITKYITIVRTNFPNFINEEACRVVHVDNPTLDVDDEDKFNINKKKREKSRKILLNNLQNIQKKENYKLPKNKFKEIEKIIEEKKHELEEMKKEFVKNSTKRQDDNEFKFVGEKAKNEKQEKIALLEVRGETIKKQRVQLIEIEDDESREERSTEEINKLKKQLVEKDEELEELRQQSLTEKLNRKKSELEDSLNEMKKKLGLSDDLGVILEMLLKIQANIVRLESDTLVEKSFEDLANILGKKLNEEQKEMLENICQQQKKIIQLEEVIKLPEILQEQKDIEASNAKNQAKNQEKETETSQSSSSKSNQLGELSKEELKGLTILWEQIEQNYIEMKIKEEEEKLVNDKIRCLERIDEENRGKKIVEEVVEAIKSDMRSWAEGVISESKKKTFGSSLLSKIKKHQGYDLDKQTSKVSNMFKVKKVKIEKIYSEELEILKSFEQEFRKKIVIERFDCIEANFKEVLSSLELNIKIQKLEDYCQTIKKEKIRREIFIIEEVIHSLSKELEENKEDKNKLLEWLKNELKPLKIIEFKESQKEFIAMQKISKGISNISSSLNPTQKLGINLVKAAMDAVELLKGISEVEFHIKSVEKVQKIIKNDEEKTNQFNETCNSITSHYTETFREGIENNYFDNTKIKEIINSLVASFREFDEEYQGYQQLENKIETLPRPTAREESRIVEGCFDETGITELFEQTSEQEINDLTEDLESYRIVTSKNIQIYKIIGKESSSYNSIEFTLHKDIPYLQKTTANKLFLANQPPFSNYKVGDYLGIDIDKTSLRFPNVERGKIYNDSAVVARVVKDENKIPSNHKKVYNKGDLDLREFSQLEKLDCSNNKITSLNISKCSKLREMDCSNNNLRKLDLNNCQELTILNCINNRFISLDLEGCKGLVRLECSQEWLNDSYPKESRSLIKNLYISNKNLEDSLNLKDFCNLEKLDCSYNQLVNLNLTGLARLEKINCDNNFLIIGNYDRERIKKAVYNRFCGSPKCLDGLTKLERFQIQNTDVENADDVYLPASSKRENKDD
ncbi:4667_t:CDS:10 [Funneliformis geosporum]|nr:4667_t:CDS:10 [Funneliformis geosporum]